MIDPVRREVLRVLGELSETCPDYRFGQLIANLAMLRGGIPRGPSGRWRMRSYSPRGKHLTDWNERHAPVA